VQNMTAACQYLLVERIVLILGCQEERGCGSVDAVVKGVDNYCVGKHGEKERDTQYERQRTVFSRPVSE